MSVYHHFQGYINFYFTWIILLVEETGVHDSSKWPVIDVYSMPCHRSQTHNFSSDTPSSMRSQLPYNQDYDGLFNY